MEVGFDDYSLIIWQHFREDKQAISLAAAAVVAQQGTFARYPLAAMNRRGDHTPGVRKTFLELAQCPNGIGPYILFRNPLCPGEPALQESTASYQRTYREVESLEQNFG